MLGSDYDDIERDGGGCSFGCNCAACRYDEELISEPRYSEHKSDEQFGYIYRPAKRKSTYNYRRVQ